MAIAVTCLSARPASAVVVSARYPDATARAPAGNPGWYNVGKRGNATGVYLGNRWVITANHVGAGSIEFSDGRVFGSVPGSAIQLTNDLGQGFGSPDLLMFRLVNDPELPSLGIDPTSPAAGDNVMMIGAGRDRGSALVGWRSTTNPWSSSVLVQSNRFGFTLESTHTMRWGTNIVTGPLSIGGATAGFSTLFNIPGVPFEAQASTGDSGGGVFRLTDGTWGLVGIMDAVTTMPGQPSDSVTFGQTTQIADLTAYRQQIMDRVTAADPLWQNQLNYYDVDRSGTADARDRLLLVNELLRSGAHALTGTPAADSPLYDISGDGMITSRDAQLLTNALIGQTANPTASPASNVMLVPEPSTAALALLGLVTIALGRRTLIVRRRGRR